jgi:hypothetical protein
VLVEVDAVEAVIANPDVDKILVDGLNVTVDLEDKAIPDPLPGLENISECCRLLDVVLTLTFKAVVALPEANEYVDVVAEPEVIAYPD